MQEVELNLDDLETDRERYLVTLFWTAMRATPFARPDVVNMDINYMIRKALEFYPIGGSEDEYEDEDEFDGTGEGV